MRPFQIRTPCRLHFGLTSLGHNPTQPQFGGVGVMVDQPCVTLRFEPATSFEVDGPLSERVEKFSVAFAEKAQLTALPNVGIYVIEAPREHVGLGTGTQLELATAAGLSEIVGKFWRDPVCLAKLTGRGKRSAVGTHGFLNGGMIVDGGQLPNESLGQLALRVDFPPGWRFLLITARNEQGRCGLAEDEAMCNLPPVLPTVTRELHQLIDSQLIPAAQRKEFANFSSALYHYGCLAGECFAEVQQGIYASPAIVELVAWLRSEGVGGVGQSSWGPTVFALFPDSESASQMQAKFSTQSRAQNYDVLGTAVSNEGAVLSYLS